MLYLGSEPYRKYYYGHKWSCATLFCLFITCAYVLLPIFLGVTTNSKLSKFKQIIPIDFWPAQLEYIEQPKVKFRNEVILLNYQQGGFYGYSTVPTINDQFANQVSNPSISVISFFYEAKVNRLLPQISIMTGSLNLLSSKSNSHQMH